MTAFNLNLSPKNAALFVITLVLTLLFAACTTSPTANYEPISPLAGRTIEHANGETVVPLEPERVVILGSVVDALALGVKPIGATLTGLPQRAGVEQLSPMLSNRTDEIVVLGHTNQPNLERIVSLTPDLILGASKARHLYAQLAPIAPTVMVDISNGASDWKRYVLDAAITLGKQSEAEDLLSQYEQRVALFRQLMGDRLETTVVSVSRFRPDHFRIYQQNSFSGAVLADIGLPRPPSQQKNKPYEKTSLEKISRLDGDVLFFMQDNPEDSMLSRVESHPLWNQLGVVKRQQVHEVSLEAWFLNPGIVSAHMMLNDLFRTLVPEGQQYVVTQVGELMLP